MIMHLFVTNPTTYCDDKTTFAAFILTHVKLAVFRQLTQNQPGILPDQTPGNKEDPLIN